MPKVEYRYQYVDKNDLEDTLSAFAAADFTVHTVTFTGAMVHVLFERPVHRG